MGTWNFFQDQVLGMNWLNGVIGLMLKNCGVDITGKCGGTLQFFLYDVIKITILLCVLIFVISYIQSYFPPERSKRILGRFHGIWANTLGALLGTITPFCSCSSIPLFIGFTRAGLPLGATFSFLISSPMVDIGSLVLLTGVFGAKVAVIYTLTGLVIAIAGGTLLEKLHMEKFLESTVEKKKPCCCCCCGGGKNEPEEKSHQSRWRFALNETRDTAKKVFPYILLGVAIGAFIHNWIPETWVENILGGRNPFGVILAVFAGTPMYADIFGTIPVAEALLGKGAQLGTVLSFMMAVTTLSLPSIIMLRKVMKPLLLGLFVGICVLGIILVGYFFNLFQHIFV